MAKQTIRTGTTADPTGDSLKNAFTKVNANFTELYNALGLDAETLNLGAFEFTGSVMTTTDSSAIVIDQATTVTSNLSVGGDLLPQTANGGNLGSSSLPWRSLYVSNNTIYIGNTAVSVNQSGKLTVGGSSISDSIGKIALGTSKLELTDEAASRLSLYNSNTEKSRIQINGNDLLLSSLSGGVVLAATDGVGGEWRFKTNGNLESTGGNFLSTAETPAVFGSLNSTSTGASSGTVTLKSGIGAVDGGSIYIEAGTGGSGNDGEVAIRTGSGPYEWLFDNGGNLTLPRGSLKHDDALGFFTVEGPVTADMIDAGSPGTYHTISNGVQILTHRPSDDLERKFRFSWDGALYMPTDSSNGQVGAVEWRGGNTTSQVRSTPGGGIFPPGLALVSYSTDGSNAGISFNIDFNKNWIFDKYGNTRIPGDIISEGNINIDINLTDSTLCRWSFGEDGSLTFPDATTQSTAFTGNATTVDIMNTNGIDYNYSITFVENRSATQDLRADVDLTFNSWSNTLTAGNVTTGVLKIEDGVHEKFQAKADATGTVTHDCASGHVFYHTSPDANWTANFTNLNLDSGYATAVTLIIVQGGTGYYPSAVQIGGVGQTLNWQGNATPTPSTNRTDVVTFSIINNSGTYTVLGQLTGF